MATGTICKIAPFMAADTIVAVGYKVQKIVAGVLVDEVAHTTSGVAAITGVPNGYTANPTVTLDANGGAEYVIEWDSGGGLNSGEPYLDRISIPRSQ